MKYIEDNIKRYLAKSASEMLRERRNDKVLIALSLLVFSMQDFLDGSYGFMSLSLVLVFLQSLSAYESHSASKESEKRKHVIESVTFEMKDKNTCC